MKKIFLYTALILLSVSCQKDWLEREPKNILVDEQVWNDPKQLTSLLANYYNRLQSDMRLDGTWNNMADYDDAMWSGNSNQEGKNNIVSYPGSRWEYWDYGLIRDINLSLENTQNLGANLAPAVKTQFLAEFRFLRAWVYFEMVRRMGGVPLVTTQLIYKFDGDVTPLQKPRAKEEEVYDFIVSELDAIKEDLGNIVSTGPSQTRANKYTALALKGRVLLYAGSIAKYNNLMPIPITLPGGEVGLPASRANEYFQKSLDASLEVINSGFYSLKSTPANPGQGFYEAVTKKGNNREAIFVKDFLIAKSKRHTFTYENIARGIREDNLSSSQVSPSLNLVESYDYLDGSPGTMKTRTADNSDYIYYDRPEDIFANKDGRLAGTILYPGSTFKGFTIDMQAGVKVWNGASYQTIEGANPGVSHTDGKTLVAASGPHRSVQDVSRTGFYLRKYIDDGAGTSTRGIQSDVWWVWMRLGEVYLNAAEAAFELGNTPVALTYINLLRERAGFTPNSLATITIDKIRQERRVELAFEDHRVWDLRRWRIGEQVWDGTTTSSTAMLYALYPYRVIRPGDPRDGKFVYDRIPAPRFISPRFFQRQNYYSFIPQNALDNNPLLVRNPLQ